MEAGGASSRLVEAGGGWWRLVEPNGATCVPAGQFYTMIKAPHKPNDFLSLFRMLPREQLTRPYRVKPTAPVFIPKWDKKILPQGGSTLAGTEKDHHPQDSPPVEPPKPKPSLLLTKEWQSAVIFLSSCGLSKRKPSPVSTFAMEASQKRPPIPAESGSQTPF